MYSDEIVKAVDTAVKCGKNLLIWGPSGVGKSTVALQALKKHFSDDEIYLLSCGEGLDEAQLWGGLDFKALKTEGVLRYRPEDSFLAKEAAILEEIFDSPTQVLLSLKDTLTRKELVKGAQRFPMKTKILIGITNVDPSEIAGHSPSAAALIERFPLSLMATFDGDYEALFRGLGKFTTHTGSVLSAALQYSSVSPRLAVHTLEVMEANLPITLVNGLPPNIKDKLDAERIRVEQLKELKKLQEKVNNLNTNLTDSYGVLKLLKFRRKVREVELEIRNTPICDELYLQKATIEEAALQLLSHVESLMEAAVDKEESN